MYCRFDNINQKRYKIKKSKINEIQFKNPEYDTKLGHHIIPSKSSHLNDEKQEAFDLQTYKKFLSFLKFQEMMDKYNN